MDAVAEVVAGHRNFGLISAASACVYLIATDTDRMADDLLLQAREFKATTSAENIVADLLR